MELEARDAARVRGAAKIELIDVVTKETTIGWEGPNSAVDDGLNFFLNRLMNTTGASPLSHLIIGSGTVSTVNTAGSLGHEVYRKAITSASISGSVLTAKTYLTTAQARDETIRELGLTNSAASGKGVLLNYIEVSPGVEKATGKEAVITITVTTSRA